MEFVPLLVTAIAVAVATMEWLLWNFSSAFRTGLNDQMTAQIVLSMTLAGECARASNMRGGRRSVREWNSTNHAMASIMRGKCRGRGQGRMIAAGPRETSDDAASSRAGIIVALGIERKAVREKS